MTKVVLDASALLALLQQEKGSDQVAQHLPNAMMSSINFSEVIAVLIHTGIPEKEAKMFITDIVKQIIPFDVEQAYPSVPGTVRQNLGKMKSIWAVRKSVPWVQVLKTKMIQIQAN